MSGGPSSSQVDLADAIAAVREEPPGTPVTAREISEALSCSRRTAYDKLQALAERGDLATKKTGARGRVWWRPVTEDEARSGEAAPGPEPNGRLGALAASTRPLRTSEDPADVGDVVAAALESVPDVEEGAVYRFDTTDNRLVPDAGTGASGEAEGAPIATAEDSPVWDSFVEDEPCILDPTAETVLPGSNREDRFELVVPLGDHGVVVASTAERTGIDDARTSIDLVATLATTTLDRDECRRTLRDQGDRLADRERHLERVTRIGETVRAVDRALVRETTLEAVQTAVPAAVTGDDRFRFAWVGAVDEVEGTLEPQAHAGDDDGYLASVSLAEGEDPEPATEAAATGDVAVASNVADDIRLAPWRREAMSRGLQSAIAVPLARGDVHHGVLAVYADEPDSFGELERSAFADLGATIGNAMDAIATRNRLLCDTVVELEFVLDDAACFLSTLADATGGEVAFNGVVPATETSTRIYATVRDADAASVRAAIEDVPRVESMRLVATRADQHLVEAVVTGRTIPALVVDHDASIRTLTADGEEAHVAVEVPSAVDVRAFVERVREAFPSADFVARRERDRPIQSRRGFRSTLEERLTDRQREVLETAYHSGLYASPRRSTVGEIADALDVSQPTVTEHLQSAQAKLLELVFAEDAMVE